MARRLGFRNHIQNTNLDLKYYTEDGLKLDPEKVAAVEKISSPKSRKELECQLGMFTYLSQYSPHLSQRTACLKELCKEDREWIWCPKHKEAFTEIEKMITEVPGPVLQYYDPSKPVRVQIDASQSGLGAVVMQSGRLIACADRKGNFDGIPSLQTSNQSTVWGQYAVQIIKYL